MYPVDIMIGLPGSGKTTFAKSHERYRRGILEDKGIFKIREKDVEYAIKTFSSFNERLVVDVLLKTADDLNDLLEKIENVLSKYDKEPEYTFYVFNPNKERSLVNDFVRKRWSAEHTIEYMYENWDFELDKLPGDVIIMPTYEPTDAAVLMYENNVKSSNITENAIVSDSWLTDIWYTDDIEGEFYDDDEEEIDKYDNPHLEKFLNFLGDENTPELRKELIDKLANKIEDEVYDYYDGYVENYYKIDMGQLVHELKLRKLI